MVLPLGFEPRSSPHLEASPRYKAGALTVKLWEQKDYGGDGVTRTHNARGGGFTVHWGYQFSYISMTILKHTTESATVQPNVIGPLRGCSVF